MCGIIGYYHYNTDRKISHEIFDRAVDLMVHRGPDGKGLYQKDEIGLGHRRLSILDLSDRASQPMFSADKKIVIVYNGEIYNFLSIKRKLKKKGVEFKSTSDTEVILQSYIEWGLQSIDMLKGIFAFAIWDYRFKRLWLVRDPVGVKPLYFSDFNGTLYFSSDISALISFPSIPKEPDPYGIDTYFTYSFIPAPMTGYKHIKQLLPGQYLLAEQKNISLKQYWNINLEDTKATESENECIEFLDQLLTDVVKRQMIADVPVGTFLSSGVDSFAITRAMRKTESKSLMGFSIGFNENSYNEIENAKLAAKVLDVQLLSDIFRPEYKSIINKITRHCKDPFADSSCFPTYLLCALASKHVKVALSGDGADELLAGYSVYKANNYAHYYRMIPKIFRRSLIKPIAQYLPDFGSKYTIREKATRFVYGAEKGKWRDHASWRVMFTEEQKKRTYKPEFKKLIKDFDPISLYVEHMEKARDKNCSDLDCFLYADFKFYLPNDMLVKVDRMSMANGLEVRVPFLDVDIVNFCWKLPMSLKIRNGRSKYILRKVIEDIFPGELKKLAKSGFNMFPYDNFIPDLHNNRFCNIMNLNKSNIFSNYSKFCVDYQLYILGETEKNYTF